MSLRSHSVLLQKVGGVIVVAIAIAILLGWNVQLQLWLIPIFPALPFVILFHQFGESKIAETYLVML